MKVVILFYGIGSTDNSSDFEEPLEINDLASCHGQENDASKKYHGEGEVPPGVGALVNRHVEPFTQVHVILFMASR